MVISDEMKGWTKEKVFGWLQTECNLSEEQAQQFLTQEIDGEALQCLTKQEFFLANPPLQLTLGAAAKIFSRVQNASGQILLLFSCNRSPWYHESS
jgi:hypothetical protein